MIFKKKNAHAVFSHPFKRVKGKRIFFRTLLVGMIAFLSYQSFFEPQLEVSLWTSQPDEILALDCLEPEETMETDHPFQGPSETETWIRHTLQPQETFSQALKELRVSYQDVMLLSQNAEHGAMLHKVRAGHVLEILKKDEHLMALRYHLDRNRYLSFERQEDGFSSEILTKHYEYRPVVRSAVIEHSLAEAAKVSSTPANILMHMTQLLSWDIDFAKDLRPGDSFKILYEEKYYLGEKIGTGPMLAAEFKNRNKVYTLYRYSDPRGHTGYYTQEGINLRRPFIRSPVRYTRISSPFDLNRKHPILKTIRAHRGVDYAAPMGTPIHATADGRVIFKGTKGGYGKTLILQHGTLYSTLYAHLNDYAKNLDKDSLVSQGDVIGYVGKTGLASGPHLHYEFRIQGIHHDPVTVPLPQAQPIDAAFKDDFLAHQKDIHALLQAVPFPNALEE